MDIGLTPDERLAIFLIPDSTMSKFVESAQQLLEEKFGVRAARVFSPHITLKGFFQPTQSLQLSPFVASVEEAVHSWRRSPIINGGIVGYDQSGVALRVGISRDGNPDENLMFLHRSILGLVLPLVSEDCEFTNREWYGERWDAHITLASHDVSAATYERISAFLNDKEIGPVTFDAIAVELLAFSTGGEAWTGRWWNSLRSRVIRRWEVADV